jgi:competence ComEA-like helix-hairpin-helix protein
MAKRRDRSASPEAEALEPKDEAKEAIRASVEANTGYEPAFEKAWTAERRLDLNTASEAELQELPGIGPDLAAGIVAYRAEMGGFREAAEITHAPGITADVYDRFADRVEAGGDFPDEIVGEEGVILPAEARVEIEEEPTPVLAAPEPVMVVEEVLKSAAAPPPSPPPPKAAQVTEPPSRRGIGWSALLLVGLLSAVAGALLALVVLWLLNGTLDMQQSAERRLRSEVFRLEGNMEAIRAQVGGVEERMAGVESLAGDLEQAQGEIRNLKGSVDSLQSDIRAATSRMEDMQRTLAGLSDDMVNVEEDVTALNTQYADLEARLGTMAQELIQAQKAVLRFEAFLAGLRALLSETAADGLGTGPLLLQTMTPSANPTATRRPRVTVIPLATPTPTLP